MRDATLEEQQAIQENIDKISKPTGINFNDYLKQQLEEDPELRKEYEALEDEFEAIRTELEARVNDWE